MHRLKTPSQYQRQRQRHRTRYQRRIGRLQQAIDHLPQRHRLALRDKVNLARHRRSRRQPLCCEQMRVRCVVDMNRVDQIAARSDLPQLPRLGARHHARQQMIVTWPPDEVRAQAHRRELRIVRRDHCLFSERFGARVVRLVMRRIRHRLIHPFHVAAIKHHAGRAGVNKARYARRAARGDHVLGAAHVGAVIVRVFAPEARLGRDVKHHVATLHRCCHRRSIRDVALHLLHAQRRQRRISLPRKAAHRDALTGKTTRDQSTHNRSAQKSAAACDQSLHRIFSAAHTASSSRKILALCRTSTGNDG